MSKRLKPPFPGFEIAKRDTAIVLKDGRAAIEQQLPHAGEVRFVQEYDALLMKLSAGPSLARKAEKPLRSNEPSARLVLK